MTPHDTFDTCMDALADTLGIALPARAEGDAVVLSIDGTEVTFREDADGRTVLLSAEIGEMPPDARGVFSSLALQFNYSSLGGTALFAMLAMAGDLGGAFGPSLVGTVTQQAGDNLQSGMLAGSIFPLVMIIALILLSRKAKKQ